MSQQLLPCWAATASLFMSRNPHPTPLHFAGTQEKHWEALIRRTVDAIVVAALHPRALIQIVVQVGAPVLVLLH